MNPADKRLAVMVPDYLVDDIDLEGIIPRGSYGAWPVVVWASVTYEAVEPGDPMEQIKGGKFAFILHGKKLRGTFALTRLARRETGKERLLIKQKDEYADPAWKLKIHLTPARLKKLGVKIPLGETS
jgi:bifunctional non-homologous end joining protein LigD